MKPSWKDGVLSELLRENGHPQKFVINNQRVSFKAKANSALYRAYSRCGEIAECPVRYTFKMISNRKKNEWDLSLKVHGSHCHDEVEYERHLWDRSTSDYRSETKELFDKGIGPTEASETLAMTFSPTKRQSLQATRMYRSRMAADEDLSRNEFEDIRIQAEIYFCEVGRDEKLKGYIQVRFIWRSLIS